MHRFNLEFSFFVSTMAIELDDDSPLPSFEDGYDAPAHPSPHDDDINHQHKALCSSLPSQYLTAISVPFPLPYDFLQFTI